MLYFPKPIQFLLMGNTMEKKFVQISEAISGICLALIVLTILVSVILRGVFNTPLISGGELSSMFIVWSIYSVFALNFFEEKHFKIDIVDTLVPKRVMVVLDVLVDFLTFGILIILLVYSMKAIETNKSIRTVATGVPIVFVFYLPFLLGCLSFLGILVMKYVRLIASTRDSHRRIEK